MKKFILTIGLPLIVGVFIAGAVYSATTGSVSVTVTAQNISVSVTDGDVAYGSMPLGSTTSTATKTPTETQTATNDGNVTENFNILGANTDMWTLAGTAGTNQYTHKFCRPFQVTCASPPTNYTALTTSYQTFATTTAAAGTRTLDLEIGVPTVTTYFSSTSTTVTVQAVLSS